MMKSIIIVLIALATLANAYYLEYEKVRLVDHTPVLSNGHTNYLFRGNEPKIAVHGQDEFAYDELVEYMRNVSKADGVIMPEQFLIYDIKLIYGVAEEMADVHLEQWYFGNNTDHGMFAINITLGDITNPKDISKTLRDSMAKTLPDWQKDDLPSRMAMYRDILYTPYDLPIALYIHCECGCDRTGEVFASYVMKYLGWDYKKAMEWDDQVAGRPILPNHQWSVQWYCLYLSLGEKMNIDCTGAY
ncbi:hypothetical protein SAMD00019534_003330 [Acytostelium subglobosum LB1]|uniref:hypothetical protein n=1 Tax=Acytostelium subglobosum LB1 TaxID=1410327 RepID=UPI000644F357|nr:hypothetical protein SAMD00019534_003330 [Acytostelium subglobosum LB1]GAM17158.1 hypothetical protein SAMD00019534_003330 [Acytostelium subglobosum LB1]|eukprot:XP_012759220.1 hypothetical protein SAMD00019534_003330 [Acytostelium subglobosum LB1]